MGIAGPVTEKKCSSCSESVPLTNYQLDKRAKDGHAAMCKPCRNGRRRRGNKFSASHHATKPAQKPVRVTVDLNDEDSVLREARKRAVLKLVQNHRSEFDTLVYRSRMGLQNLKK